MCTVTSFCNSHYEVDPITNDIVDGDGTTSVKSKRVSTNCTYDVDKEVFVFPLGMNSSVYITSTVYDGENISEEVVIDGTMGSGFIITKNGEALEDTDIYYLRDAGYYVVSNISNDEKILSFNILPGKISNLNKFEVPSLYYLVNVYFNGEKISSGSMNYVLLDNEGEYTITYRSSGLDISRTVSFIIDKSGPVLEISGVTDGIAKGPVSIGSREVGSTLVVLLNGESVAVKDTYTNYGTYHLIYTDEAGNVSTYDFVIKMYLDINAGFVVGILAVIAVGVVGYMIYLRKHMRTC